MKQWIPLTLLATISLTLLTSAHWCEDDEWGFFGHRRINRMAVFTLPSEMVGFYKQNIEFITDHAVDPDKRRYATKHEAVRHYIDIDHWGENPFEAVPKYHSEAIMKYCDFILHTLDGDTLHLLGNALSHSGLHKVEGTENTYSDAFGNTQQGFEYVEYSHTLGQDMIVTKDALAIFGKDKVGIPLRDLAAFAREQVMPMYYEDKWMIPGEEVDAFLAGYGAQVKVKKAEVVDNFSQYGISPYNLLSQLERLTRAFEAGDKSRILRLSAELGHYVGDAHVPLHTTENYNGQLTGQDGIHGFWESRIPELFADETYDFWAGKAEYIDNPREYFWGVIETSHSYVDSVLTIERDLRQNFPEDKQYCYETRGGLTVRLQCKEFAAAYQARMGGMVEQRMRDNIQSIGSVWFTAWVNAGQPKLKGKDEIALSDKDKQELEEQEKLFQAGETKGREHSNY